MGTPSPFEVSRTISNNLGQAYRSAQDSNAIDKILSEANASGNPQVLQDSIGKILSQVSPERQPQAIQYLQNRYQAVQEQEKRKRQEISAQRGGYDIDAPSGVQTQQVKGNQQMNAYNQVLGNAPMQQQGILPNTGVPGQQPQIQGQQPPTQQQNGGVGIQSKTDEELVAMHAIPSLKPAAEAEQKRRESLKASVENRLKDTKEQRLEYANKGKYGRQGIANKKQQIALLKTGNIDTPVKTYVASLLPGAIGNQLLSPETQVYKAGLFEEFGVLKSMFPGQIRVKEIELLEDKLATLDKNHAAKQAILENGVLKLEQDVILAKHAAKIEKEHPEAGIGEFDQLVAESAEQDLSKLYDKIIKGYEDIYIDYAKPQTTFVDQNGMEYPNVPKKDLRELLEATKQQGLELRPK